MTHHAHFQQKARVRLAVLVGLLLAASGGCREAQQAKVSARRTGTAVHQWYDHARDRVTGRTDPRVIPEPQPEVID